MKKIFGILVLLGAVSGSFATVLDGAYNPTTGHIYYLLDQATWEEAEAEAVSLGGHLVTINDADENAWVFNQFGGVSADQHLWIGLTDRDIEGVFSWVDEDSSGYRNWAPTEPNSQGDEDFVQLYTGGNGTSLGMWNDISGTFLCYAVAEIIPSDSVSTNGLVAYYPFNGNANDATTNGYNGTVNGAVLVADRFGNENHAYSFDGVNDYLLASGIPYQTPYSFSLWFRCDSTAIYTQRHLINFNGQSGEGEYLCLAYNWEADHEVDGLRLLYRYLGGGSGGVNVYRRDSLHDDEWHHAVAVVSTNAIKIYSDGVLYEESSIIPNPQVLADLFVGCNGPNYNRYYKGQLDDVRIYNRALSSSEAASLYVLSLIDSDGDGLYDDEELNTHLTDPNDSDSDDDGLNDGVEVNTYGSNPMLADTDGDGFDDGFEVSTGFDPATSSSTPDLLSAIQTAIEFKFNGANGVSYRIEATDNLTNPWETVETDIIGEGGVVSRLYSIEGQPNRFFRARRN